MMRGCLVALILFTVGCGTAATPDTPRIEPTKFAVPEVVNTCGDVIEAALATLFCDPVAGEICALSAEFLPDDPTANLIGTVPMGRIDETTTLDSLVRVSQTGGELIGWRGYVMNTAAATLIMTDGVRLDNITPILDALTLETAAESDVCSDASAPVLMVQANTDDEVNLTINGAQITVGATAAITAAPDDVLTIYTLQGLSVVSSGGVTRVVREGSQITVPMDGLTISGEPAPSVAASGDVISNLPLDALPRPLTITELPRSAQIEQIQSGSCEPNPNWQGEYTVQRGDNLTIIANRYDISYQELQAGNCILNPRRIRPGLTLRVPAPANTPTPQSVLTQAAPAAVQQADGLVIPANATVVIVPAYSDNSAASPLTVDAAGPIVQGTCTTVRWTVANASQIYLDEQPVPAQGSRQVCPQITTVLTLRVVYANGTEQSFTQAVFVRSG